MTSLPIRNFPQVPQWFLNCFEGKTGPESCGTLGGYHAAQDYLRGKIGRDYKLPQIA